MSLIDDPKTRHRRDDHETSMEAAQAVGLTGANLKTQLLHAWGMAGALGLTDEEASRSVYVQEGSCWWKRAGELRAVGAIRWHPEGETRRGASGMRRKVSVVTESGKRELRSYGVVI